MTVHLGRLNKLLLLIGLSALKTIGRTSENGVGSGSGKGGGLRRIGDGTGGAGGESSCLALSLSKSCLMGTVAGDGSCN